MMSSCCLQGKWNLTRSFHPSGRGQFGSGSPWSRGSPCADQVYRVSVSRPHRYRPHWASLHTRVDVEWTRCLTSGLLDPMCTMRQLSPHRRPILQSDAYPIAITVQGAEGVTVWCDWSVPDQLGPPASARRHPSLVDSTCHAI